MRGGRGRLDLGTATLLEANSWAITQGYWGKLQTCFALMQEDGVQPNYVTMAHCLRCFQSVKRERCVVCSARWILRRLSPLVLTVAFPNLNTQKQMEEQGYSSAL